MKSLSRLIFIALAMAIVASCVENLDKTHFRVECTVAPELGTDSVSLMLVMDDYNSVRHVATVSRNNAGQPFVFEGNVENPSIAYLKFSNDSTPMMFVIEPGLTQIDISAHGLIISGGEANHEYMVYVKARQSLLTARRSLHQEYLGKVAPDSTVDESVERRYLTLDSVLTDSLERITVDAINQENVASRIIFERYVNTLSRKNLQNIHKK